MDIHITYCQLLILQLRFLQVKPATAQDKDLLSHLLLSLSTLLDQHHRYGETHGSSVCLAAADDERDNRGKSRYQGELLGARFLSWLVEQTAGEETMCQQTLRSLLQSQGDHEDHRERYKQPTQPLAQKNDF